eukprot:711405-Pyramimonas_sp.AAC.1
MCIRDRLRHVAQLRSGPRISVRSHWSSPGRETREGYAGMSGGMYALCSYTVCERTHQGLGAKNS